MEDNIDITLIIPAYNEEVVIEQTIMENRKSLKGTKYEIIAVNDGSTDGTKEIVTNIVKQYSSEVQLIDIAPNKGKYNALNIGIEKAKGDIIVCSDADSYLCRDAYPQILRDFKSHEEVIAMVGLVHPYNDRKLIAKLQEIEYIFEQKVLRDVQYKWKNVMGIPGPLFAFRCKDINKLKDEEGRIFNNSIVEDFELAIRLNAKKLKIFPSPEIITYTKVPETLGELRKQRLRWFGGTLYETLKHKAWKYNPFYGVNLLMMFIAPVFLILVAIQLGLITYMSGGILLPIIVSFFAINTLVGGVHAICIRKLYLTTIFIFPLYLLLVYLLRVESVFCIITRRKIVWGK